MSWIYAFAERGEERYTKIGSATSHYHDRFAKTQQCNAVDMYIAAVWRFPDPQAAKACEKEIKKGLIRKWRSPKYEWYAISPAACPEDEILAGVIARHGGQPVEPEPYAGKFSETLNRGCAGANGQRYRPHLYLIGEMPDTGLHKLVLTAYNGATALAHYATYNPRQLELRGRWSFPDEAAGRQAYDGLLADCAAWLANPLGWVRASAETLTKLISDGGAEPYPWAVGFDDTVDYTGRRVSAAA